MFQENLHESFKGLQGDFPGFQRIQKASREISKWPQTCLAGLKPFGVNHKLRSI